MSESCETHNPPAFPCEAQGDRSVPAEHDYIQTGTYSAKFPGMSLRDYFAGRVLVGVMSVNSPPSRTKFQPEGDNEDAQFCAETAWFCYIIADAMLAERAKARTEGRSDA